MMKLTEYATRVIAHLEEAGSENISSTVNTVLNVTGAREEVHLFQAAAGELIKLDLVRIAVPNADGARSEIENKDASLKVLDDLENRIAFSADEGIWKWKLEYPRAEIVALPEGMVEARRLLKELGYEWWRTKT